MRERRLGRVEKRETRDMEVGKSEGTRSWTPEASEGKCHIDYHASYGELRELDPQLILM